MSDTTIKLQLPVALLRVWSRSVESLANLPNMDTLPLQGIHHLRPDLFAVLPAPGDPAVMEAANVLAQRLFLTSPAGAKVFGLVLPSQLFIRGGQLELPDEAFLRDLDLRAPELNDREVCLTAHAVYELESRWSVTNFDAYQGPSGRTRTLRLLDQPGFDRPWHNVEVMGRATAAVKRDVFVDLRGLLAEPASLITGGLGCGKTRAVNEVLGSWRDAFTTAWSPRSGGPSLIKQMVLQLQRAREGSDRPILTPDQLPRNILTLAHWWHRENEDQLAELTEHFFAFLDGIGASQPISLVCDNMHQASERDVDLVQQLLDSPGLGRSYRLCLMGRSGGAWTQSWKSLPHFEVPPMTATEMETVCHQLVHGLSMPKEVQQRFVEFAHGSPLALEEGLLQLVRRRVLRQLYGNFFFSGSSDTDFEPSSRWIRNVEAELRRLGEPLPLRLLAASQTVVPQATLEETLSSFEIEHTETWSEPFRSNGFVDEISAAWGSSLGLRSAAVASALRNTLTEESAAMVKRRIGTQLETETPDPDAGWERYRMLAGTPEAVRVLLKVARRSATGPRARETFEALREELESHRQQAGDPEVELALLWLLLPLARRLGALQNLEEAIDRALELAQSDERKLLPLMTLKSEHAANAGKLKDAEAQMLRCLELAKGGDPTRQSLLLIQLGKLLQRQGRFAQARKLFETFLPNVDQEGNPSLAATCRYHLGNIALHAHRLEQALDFHQQALRLRQEHALHNHIGSSLAAMGAVTLSLGNYPRALRLYHQCQEVLEDHGTPGEISFALLGIGRTLSRLGDYTGASKALRRALEEREGLDDQTGEAIARLALAENQLLLGQIDSAELETRKALFDLTLLGAMKYVADAELLLGRIHFQQRQYVAAEERFLAAFELHQENGFLHDATFDRARRLEAALALEDSQSIRQLTDELATVLSTIRYPELGERLDLSLYRGMMWLRAHGEDSHDPVLPLQRAHDELYRKTELLDTELRNRFLFQIPDNRAILNAATEHSLTPRSA